MMKAARPSSASEMTWNATSRRLCRIIAAAPRRLRAPAPRSRRRTARGRNARRGGGSRPASKRLRSSAARSASANAVGGRLVDEQAGLSWHDRLERAAAPQRHHRAAAGLRFERHDAEVLFAGQQHDTRRGDTARAPRSLARRPRNSARPRAARSSAARSGPSPTIFSGTPSQAHASIATSMRL